jgi:hypothetical protein
LPRQRWQGRAIVDHRLREPDTFPDFTGATQATPEDNLVWQSIIRNRGPFPRLLADHALFMPSSSEALTSDQVKAVIQYNARLLQRTKLAARESNLPLALATEKAYQENEEVITAGVNVKGAPGTRYHVIHEERFGDRNQIEVDVPVEFTRPKRGLWYGGFGDVTLGLKRVLPRVALICR